MNFGNYSILTKKDAEVLSIGSYGDASFHGKTLVHLGVLLWKAGMIRGCSKKILFGIRMFCVHKKTVVEDFSSVDLQRLIFDLRRVNLFFQSPPPCAMGSLSALAGVDLSDRELERISRRLKTEPGAPRCDAERLHAALGVHRRRRARAPRRPPR